MKRVLVFREGQSGNFLKLLLENDQNSEVNFRISDQHSTNRFNLTLTHEVNASLHEKQFDQVLRILPSKKIYLACYNNFMKKLIVEQAVMDFDHWRQHTVDWYDTCYSNINEYYQLITQDIATNQYKNIIDFDCMLQDSYIKHVMKQYFDQEFSLTHSNLLQQYRDLQFQIDLDADHTSMQDIVSLISDEMFEQNPWFFSYCVHKFEKNNGLTEKHRKWTINNCVRVQTRRHLLEICDQYDPIKKIYE